MSRAFVLTLACPDTIGIVHAVSGFLVDRGGNVTESSQYGDPQSGRFFMRVAFEADAELDDLQRDFAGVAEQFAMSWQLYDAARPTRALVLVSKFGHCLNDLVFRTQMGSLNIEIPAIVSNHRDFERLADSSGIPFFHIPVTKDTKPEAEARLIELVDELDIDLVVLARYMQVLSDDLCRTLDGRAINIHHSFLPSFKGARPYHQAHARGVKLIGATAHYVTADLDEGPIIEQDVARVEHAATPEQMVVLGRDVETQVLARAVGWHADHRVLLDGHRTIVFR
ncbi:formyltetrahydrofolate deformylase [Arsenicicoccus piscis]|uniref:Formyltetrahydrofolate deformylase n=1 Tax=Arsenicicoccus piscis TaxID=673954 RepID=A0ABQ6HS87_9MICO|nr:formyltetrahydrofolate deformylase [Arsenicicoccus piscis]MCH8626536.1 formyltetrahydrofolate deformylase [Arsenicicoccus piscis]GMA21181.1 formyltetrahydrofolate deformylase [Arsenicicoccus piscis]